MKKAIQIHPADSVAVALQPLRRGEQIVLPSTAVTLQEDIPLGHKFALRDIDAGENIIKYGTIIGHAMAPIKAGEHVHTHNMKTNLSDILEYSYHPVSLPQPKAEGRTFQGFVRSDGQVGIRNEIWIIPTVGCVNGIVRQLEQQAQSFIHGSVDGILAFTHPYGCSQMGDDQENTRRVLADLVHHPNAGGILVLGLGCENSNINVLKPYIGDYDSSRVRFVQAQDEEDEVETCLQVLKELCDLAAQDQRTTVPASKLRIGLKCGGSDGLSGITANPAVGRLSDLVCADGGSTVLCEVPEMFGAEQQLMNRCADEQTFEKTVRLINDFKDYFKAAHQTIYENPSPGNKAGGISTLEDKSNGCVQKSGTSPVNDVLAYGDRVQRSGLNLLSTPGNDLVAASGEAAAGCQMILFTTGRGTPFASCVPTLKIATNDTLAGRKNNWIDFNAGVIVDGTSIDECGEDLYDLVIATANGQKAKSEAEGYHDLAIFKQGVTL
ncbi:MAG: altronate dehydratase family protein [Galactobacillus timonensis]|uniref:UxaA family hydrolase n=1 Tax=Galactobacillus timonensis TaxID=2041840 RepID=UPI0023F4329A|nr:altronate dehydratase family protein [Galactobacillus timonensis]MDY5223421.1 altronate dehydratase family protein [Lachnospiraceae bacterium]MDY6281638.1 altronate dehydratase family protein [Erysipelotrichaceae bacterium]MCI6068526.1 altronate dehydratase family protein [Galactobacillus timonensis]MCI6755167.1 altronate dehydratase family protein [Galactobacillus timonensis]MDD7087424.1 altronate dehydratase family protein [Galactobacillus timonensis]